MLDLLKGAANKVATRIFGTQFERNVRRLKPFVDAISLELEKLQTLSDEELQAKTPEFRARLEKGAAVDDLLPEAFAVVKEACRRHVGKSWAVVGQPLGWEMLPFDVQLMGGVVLHQGSIAEMATGEGKTLVAIFPLYLNALSGKGAHLVTVNDYLARRDSEWVGQILTWLGLSVGVIQHDMDTEARRAAYLCDVTYGTNNEFGFDYLRDNMVVRSEDRVQRPHHFAIVDEVDSVLVDEARTPLIISGAVAHSNQQYEQLRGPVEDVVRRQNELMSRLMEEAEGELDSTDQNARYRAALRLLQVQRGAPRNKRLAKITADGDAKKRMHDVESDFMREKRVHELDEGLLFSIDERGHAVSLSEEGREILSPNDPSMFVLPDLAEQLGKVDKEPGLSAEEKLTRKEDIHRRYALKSEQLGNVQQLLKAYCLYEKDREYVVQEGKVLIVDEFTGRLMPGRRFSDGLHQALEAKERVRVGEENQTLATITIQNYFRLYEKLAGMTGTAETEAAEFHEIYKLEVVVIPTNEPVRRVDYEDYVFKTRKEKYDAILEEIETSHKAGRPVLVGTVSVEVSETLSRMLKRKSIPHHVLNAKYHQQEAEIVTRAGQPGAVTIATNMAGRGTDIKLGPGVVKGRHCLVHSPSGTGDCAASPGADKCKADMPCGLHIIGTERHEARRIDRQLRGRSGRQGDPGSSRFFLSLEDDLMRLFMSDRVAGMMDKLGVQEGEVITHSLVTSAIGRAQKRVEVHNFSIRKHLLDYDTVMNQQREVIYGLRDEILNEEDVSARIQELMENQIDRMLEPYKDSKLRGGDWEQDLAAEIQNLILSPVEIEQWVGWEAIEKGCQDAAREAYRRKEEVFGAGRMRDIERRVFMAVIDEKWRDHLHEIDQLRSGISLRAYGQKDPLLEYKGEAYRMFEELMAAIETDSVRFLFRVVPAPEGQAEPPLRSPSVRPAAAPSPPYSGPPAARNFVPPSRPKQTIHTSVPQFGSVTVAGSAVAPPPRMPAAPARAAAPIRSDPKVGRNDPCPCGSGKKYKKCHGADV